MNINDKSVDDLKIAKEAVLLGSTHLPCLDQIVKGYDFNQGVDWHKLMDSYMNTGFQATHLGIAIQVSFDVNIHF